MEIDKKKAFEAIGRNIEKFGLHVYLVQQSAVPRFAYSIGLSPKLGFEVLFPGGIFYNAEQVHKIVDDIGRRLTIDPGKTDFSVDGIGEFSLRSADDSWAHLLMLGASDYYQQETVHARQIVPDEAGMTIDVPNCALPWRADSSPIWQWLQLEWQFPVPMNSVAAADLRVFRGGRVIQAARWENDQWEMFSVPMEDLSPEQVRVAPLGTLLAFDETLSVVLDLDIGGGVVRDLEDMTWRSWD